jgi:aryl-alcohol dehydrogenase-like predicted oxidoreductase
MPLPVETVFPKGQVRASCEASLRALGTDAVDLIQLHVYWPVWGLSGYWMDELKALKEEGKARFVGVSIPDHRSDMALGVVESGLIDSVQTIVNIFDPLALENLVPACRANKVALLARCVLDEGGLTGFLRPDTAFRPGDYREAYFDEIIPRAAYIARVEALKEFVPQHASSLAALALKFVLHDPDVTTALVSMHVAKFAEMNIAALDEPPLSTDAFDALFVHHRFIKNLNYAGQKFW